MKIKEIIVEEYVDDLESDVESLLVAARASGINSFPTDKLYKEIKSMGYSVTPNALIDYLSELDMVQSADASVVKLNTDFGFKNADGDVSSDEEQESEKVASLAQQQVKKEF